MVAMSLAVLLFGCVVLVGGRPRVRPGQTSVDDLPRSFSGSFTLQTQRALKIEASQYDGSQVEHEEPEADVGSSFGACESMEISGASSPASRRGAVLMQGEIKHMSRASTGVQPRDPLASLEDEFDTSHSATVHNTEIPTDQSPSLASYRLSVAFVLELAFGALVARGFQGWCSGRKGASTDKIGRFIEDASQQKLDRSYSEALVSEATASVPSKKLPADLANTDDASASLDVKDKWSCTALHRAASRGDVLAARSLLDRRADVNALEAWEETPLHLAARSNLESAPELCRLLLSQRAQVNAKDLDDRTPLLTAAHAGSEAICDLLLDYGANAGDISDEAVPRALDSVLSRRLLLGIGAPDTAAE